MSLRGRVLYKKIGARAPDQQMVSYEDRVRQLRYLADLLHTPLYRPVMDNQWSAVRAIIAKYRVKASTLPGTVFKNDGPESYAFPVPALKWFNLLMYGSNFMAGGTSGIISCGCVIVKNDGSVLYEYRQQLATSSAGGEITFSGVNITSCDSNETGVYGMVITNPEHGNDVFAYEYSSADKAEAKTVYFVSPFFANTGGTPGEPGFSFLNAPIGTF